MLLTLCKGFFESFCWNHSLNAVGKSVDNTTATPQYINNDDQVLALNSSEGIFRRKLNINSGSQLPHRNANFYINRS
jgi:hypothetical protein